MAFTNVAVVGAGSGVGKALVEELLSSSEPIFQITVLARESSTYTSPSSRVNVVKHDLTDQKGMVEHLRGIDAVILTQGVDSSFVATSTAIIEAAIDAGVKMVMPSDFGGKDTPIFIQATAHKVPVRAFLAEKVNEGKITHTTIKNGAFFSMPLKLGYGIDYEAKKATLFDEGTQKFHTTTSSTIAYAIGNVLRSPAQFSNKTLYIHDFYTTQREMIFIIEAIVGESFSKTTLDLAGVGKQSMEGLKRGERTPQNISGTLRYAVWGEEGSSDWDNDDDSDALGLPKKDLRDELKKKMEQGM